MAAPTRRCRKRFWHAAVCGMASFFAATFSYSQETWPSPTVEDAIGMSRIHHQVTADRAVGAFSPDGRRFATVVWRGDLVRNVNVYSLLVFDLTPGEITRSVPRTVLSWDFAGDPADQDASAFEQVAFLADSRTLAFLGRKGNSPRQLYCVDVDTGRVRELTHSPTEVKSFAVAADTAKWVFSSVADADEHLARADRLDQDGVFLWDTDLFTPSSRFKAKPVLAPEPRWIRRYFLQNSRNLTPIFDSRQSRAETSAMSQRELDRGFSWQLHDEETLRRRSTLSADPRGRYALLFPYALGNQPIDASRFAHYRSADSKLDAPYALIDFSTGKLQKLIDAPHPSSGKGNGAPVWAPDGRSVAIFTLLPPPSGGGISAEPPQWVEVDIATRKVTPLDVPSGWQVFSWAGAAKELVLYDKYMGLAMMQREANGRWGGFKRVDAGKQINPMWRPATNGTVVVGVKDSTYSSPELVAVTLSSGETRTLTDLNPALRQRRYAPVEVFQWAHRYDPEASGFLIKPVDFEPGTRYPLVVLLDDATLKGTVAPYLLDAVFQLNGHAIQMLAAEGFMVLYTREPRLLSDNSDGSDEGQRMTEHVEAAVDKLEQQGLIDPNRVGLSGWSRAAWHADCVLMKSSRRFAAATKMDGGAWQYSPRLRPFTDTELQQVRTPMLFEAHGLVSLMTITAMADRLEALGKPTEILYFATASHSTTRPQHRLRSLQTHLDWWRFWLKDQEGGDPAKAAQFQRWRSLRTAWEGAERLSNQVGPLH